MLAQSDFKLAGFQYLRAYFDPHLLSALESQITLLYAMQANKIAPYRDLWRLTDIMEAMEATDKEGLYQCQKFLVSSLPVRAFFQPELMTLCASLLGVSPHLMLLEGPALFVSRPNTDRLRYGWHTEVHYYPKRRRFVNLWFPLFGDRTQANGAMWILPGSHREHWDFAEYNSGPHSFVQYEVPHQWLVEHCQQTGTETRCCEAARGDLVLFDRNLVHKSGQNTTNDYAFAIVARAWSPVDDLTLSGNMAATPYGGDIGRSDLVVER